MAREFEVPTGTIKRRLHVARQRLKEVLETIDPTLAERFAAARRARSGRDEATAGGGVTPIAPSPGAADASPPPATH